jgi:uncharacterized membrane protein
MMKLLLSSITLFVGAIVFAIPNLSRRNILFAVPVTPGFRASAEARRSIAAFRWLVGAVSIAGAAACFLVPESWLETLTIAAPVAILLGGGFSYVRQHRTLLPFAAHDLTARYREANLTTAPDRLPGFMWTAAAPFTVLAAAAADLYANWSRIPARFPTHWGIDGRPNQWSVRTPHDVYAPLLFGLFLCAWLLVLALAWWFGARRSKWRRMALGILIAAQCMMGLLLALTAVQPLYAIPMWIIVVVPFAFIVPVVWIAARQSTQPSEAPEVTPADCWKGGLLYYNPADAALFVEKRSGLGYTVNFGNHWSWVLMGGLVLVIGSVWLV